MLIIFTIGITTIKKKCTLSVFEYTKTFSRPVLRKTNHWCHILVNPHVLTNVDFNHRIAYVVVK